MRIKVNAPSPPTPSLSSPLPFTPLPDYTIKRNTPSPVTAEGQHSSPLSKQNKTLRLFHVMNQYTTKPPPPSPCPSILPTLLPPSILPPSPSSMLLPSYPPFLLFFLYLCLLPPPPPSSLNTTTTTTTPPLLLLRLLLLLVFLILSLPFHSQQPSPFRDLPSPSLNPRLNALQTHVPVKVASAALCLSSPGDTSAKMNIEHHDPRLLANTTTTTTTCMQ